MTPLFRLLFVIVILICLIVSTQSSDCVFIDDNTNHTLYLDALQHFTITYVDTDYIYHYTPCGNHNNCGGEPGMVTQTDIIDEQVCFVIAKWDHTIKPSFEPDDQTWTFNYYNGDDCYVM